jgi:PAS domain S-box-containing protein
MLIYGSIPLRWGSAMRKPTPSKYEKHVRKKLAQIKEIIAHYSSGDFSNRVDLSDIEDDEFAEIFIGLDLLADDLSSTIQELKQKKTELQKQVRTRAVKITSLNKRISRNIVEQQLIEDALRDTNEQYRLLAESARDFIFIVDRNLIIRYVNEFGARALRSTPIEITGKPLNELFPPSVFEGFKTSIEAAFSTLQPLSEITRTVFPGNRQIWLETKLSPIPEKMGRVHTILGISRDISERKSAQNALAERERFLSNIFSSILDGISILDVDLSVVQVNPIMEKWYRHAMPIVGKKCYEAYHLAKKPCDVCPSIRTLKTGKASHEVVPKRRDGGEICGWQDLFAFPLFDTDTGQIKGVIEYVRDISERKKAEEELRQSEQKFRTLADTVSAGIAIIKNGKFCYANQYLLDTTGYSLRELEEMDFLNIIHPDFKEIIRQRQIARLRGENVSPHFEYKVIFKNGNEAWVHQSGGLIDYEGSPATLVTVWDITEEKSIKNALAAEKERLDVTLGSIAECVISTDTETNIITINKAAEGLLGYSKDEAIGRRLDAVCTIIDPKTHSPNIDIFKKMAQEHGITEYKTHCVLRSRDMSEHQVEFSVAPLVSQDRCTLGMVLVLRDVTEKLKLESEIFKVRKLESIGVLAGGIAHDFNNILTGIITNLFMAKCTLPQASENYNLLVDAEKACFRASRLTKQLLTFSKGGAPIKEIASIKEIIEDTVGFCLSGSNATYSLDLPDDLMATNIDKGQIDQVINNLLINALQAMPSGGAITVKAENVLLKSDIADPTISQNPSLKPGRYVKVSIKDEGIGIPRKDIEKIFDPYFTTKSKGSGLGLTTSYAIIKNHDGIITVDSNAGKGSTFSFYLPALDVSLESAVVEKTVKKYKGGKILVMDDDDAIRTVVAQILKSYGYQVTCCASGNETVQVYKSSLDDGKPFDVVIMDLTIPGGIGGKDVVKILLDFDPSLKAIVTSGYSNDPIMANYMEYGFVGVISKPFNIDDFINLLESVIEEK